jgi:hypothetical protein
MKLQRGGFMYKTVLLAVSVLLISACATTQQSAAAPVKKQKVDRPVTSSPAVITKRGLEAVMGKDAAALKRMFGEPRLDVAEVNGRKLQFVGGACVLDTYLYAASNNAPELVTYVDARRSDGAEVDRAACINALQRR